MNEVQIPLKLTGIGAMKAELKSLKGAIASATDPAQMEELARRAGEVADRIKDANEQVAVFTSGSKFEAVSNSFSAIKGDLASLDFEGAAEKSQVFANNLGKIGKADISGAIKGITGTIKTLGGAFVKLGVQILANPIFLLVAVITAIVVGIGVFLAKLGILQKAFDFLMIPVNALINAFKRLTDWLGLTTYAAEENARKTQKANEQAMASSEKRAAKVSDAYDLEIAKAKANGKDTTDLEIKKSKAITDAAQKRVATARAEYQQIKNLTDKDSIERRKKLQERIAKENEIIKNGSKERKLLVIQEQAEEQQAINKANEEAIAAAKARAEERAKAYKEGKAAIQKEITNANKLISDSTKTQSQKEIDDTKAKDEALIAEAKKYNLDVKALEDARDLEINNIRKGTADEFVKLETKTAKTITEGIVTSRTEQLKVQGEANMKSFTDQQKANKEQLEEEKKVREAKFALANMGVEALTNLGNAFIKDQKKLEKFNKASALVQIGIDTAKAISALVAASNQNPANGVTGGIAGITQFASGILQITANIAKAKQLLTSPSSSPSGGASSSSSSGSSSSVALAVPQVNLFGQGNNMNTASAPTAVNAPQNFVVQAVVSETDITNTQNKIDKIKKGSEL
jgi:hypothetical protein